MVVDLRNGLKDGESSLNIWQLPFRFGRTIAEFAVFRRSFQRIAVETLLAETAVLAGGVVHADAVGIAGQGMVMTVAFYAGNSVWRLFSSVAELTQFTAQSGIALRAVTLLGAFRHQHRSLHLHRPSICTL